MTEEGDSRSSLALPLRTDVLQALRAATAPLHERLDAGLPIARVDAALDDYAAHLLVLRPWLLAVRQALAAAGSVELHAVARHIDDKLAELSRDLADAGRSVPVAAPAAAFRAPAGPAYAWGLAYVVEGSQLGGVVLHRRLRERLAPHPMRYLAGTGCEAGVAGRWRDFILQLRSRAADPASIRQAQRGATDAFEDLLARFGL